VEAEDKKKIEESINKFLEAKPYSLELFRVLDKIDMGSYADLDKIAAMGNYADKDDLLDAIKTDGLETGIRLIPAFKSFNDAQRSIMNDIQSGIGDNLQKLPESYKSVLMEFQVKDPNDIRLPALRKHLQTEKEIMSWVAAQKGITFGAAGMGISLVLITKGMYRQLIWLQNEIFIHDELYSRLVYEFGNDKRIVADTLASLRELIIGLEDDAARKQNRIEELDEQIRAKEAKLNNPEKPQEPKNEYEEVIASMDKK
jgi:hypothetical protein